MITVEMDSGDTFTAQTPIGIMNQLQHRYEGSLPDGDDTDAWSYANRISARIFKEHRMDISVYDMDVFFRELAKYGFFKSLVLHRDGATAAKGSSVFGQQTTTVTPPAPPPADAMPPDGEETNPQIDNSETTTTAQPEATRIASTASSKNKQ